MSGHERDVLIVRYLDGNATAEELAALNDLLKIDAESRSLLREASFQALTLADLGEGRTRRDSKGPARQPIPDRGARWNYAALAGAAALLLVIVASAAWLFRSERHLLTVVRATGGRGVEKREDHLLALVPLPAFLVMDCVPLFQVHHEDAIREGKGLGLHGGTLVREEQQEREAGAEVHGQSPFPEVEHRAATIPDRKG